MLSDYLEYINTIQNDLLSEEVFLPCKFSEETVETLSDNITILQDFINFGAITQAYKTLQTLPVSEYLTEEFVSEYKDSWQQQIQFLLKEPNLVESALDEISISFEGFVDEDEVSVPQEDGELVWDDLIEADDYQSADDILDSIDNVTKVKKELPQKKKITKKKTNSYIETKRIIEKMDTLLSSLFSVHN